MRHLLFIAVLLALGACAGGSSQSVATQTDQPVSAQATPQQGDDEEAPLLIDTKQGCSIPIEYANLAKEMSWDGDCVFGLAVGSGVLRWTDPDGNESFYRTCLRPDNPYANCSLGGGG